MSTQTTNIGLTKQAGTDAQDLDILNGNLDIIDSEVGGLKSSAVKYTSQTLTDAQKAQARDNIHAGSKITHVTNSYTISSSYGTLSQVKIYKCGGFNSIAFVITLTQALTGGTSYNIADMTAAPTNGAPIARSQIGGSNLHGYNYMIDENMKFYFTPANNVTSGTAFWLHYFFVTAD